MLDRPDIPLLPHPYWTGLRAASSSVLAYVLFVSYIGIGALAHDFGFSFLWAVLSTIFVWAGPAQVILISVLGNGGTPVEAGIAVALSGVRLLPMVVSVLPVLRASSAKTYKLVLPAHFIAVSMWVESLRLSPKVAREQRVTFANGLGTGLMISALSATAIGYFLAAELPLLLTAAMLFLTPMSFLVSVSRNSKLMVERLALLFGLIIAPILTWYDIGLDLLWTGIAGGTAAFLIHRIRARALA